MGENFCMRQFDLNCDLGEGMNNEAELMPYISSCSVACGGHVGDQSSMQDVVSLALEHGVKVGAHPSYPDQKNFGRKILDISNAELLTSLIDQIQTLQNITDSFHMKLNHVKPHGALYNLACVDKDAAKVVVSAMHSFDDDLKLYAPAHSLMAVEAMKQGITVFTEAFADRRYSSDLSLVPRSHEQALILNSDDIFHQVSSIVNGKVQTVDNETVNIQAETICIHSDTENAVTLVKDLAQSCKRVGIKIT